MTVKSAALPTYVGLSILLAFDVGFIANHEWTNVISDKIGQSNAPSSPYPLIT